MPQKLLGALLLACALAPCAAQAETTVRVGQPQAGTFQFVPLQVGTEAGIFKKHGLNVEIVDFGGGPRGAAGADGGLDRHRHRLRTRARARGQGRAGDRAWPPWRTRPIRCCSPCSRTRRSRRRQDLKGKTVSVSSKGSLTYWLAQELSRQLGFGSDGFTIAPLGTTAAQMAALKTHQIDGMIVEANAGYRLEEDGTGRVLVQFGDRIKTFHIYLLYARRAFADSDPEAVRAFLAGWFDTIAYMREHRDQTIEIVRRTAEVSPAVAARDYDELMGMFNRTGKFDPKALAVLARSFVEMGTLPAEPDMNTLITEKFLPGAH